MKKWLMGMLVLGWLVLPAEAISAHSAVVIDARTGDALFTHNADEVLPMASTTKIMTAITALEAGNLDQTYKVKKEYTLVEGSSMYLKEGEELTLRDTLYGLMLMSGNDAALAVAGECGGQEAFIEQMNEKALDLGLGNTHFDNPNGLDSENHHTTARELAKLTAYAMKNETFREIVSTKTYTNAGRTMTNHNKLLKMYPYCVGVKTGFTKKSGRCLVSAAERNGRLLVAVTLNAPDDWNDHMAMYEDCFSRFQPYTMHESGQVLGEISVQGGTADRSGVCAANTVTLWLTQAERSQIATVIRGRRFVYAPIEAGKQYGSVAYCLHGETLAQDALFYNAGSQMLPEQKGKLENMIDQIRSRFDQQGE